MPPLINDIDDDNDDNSYSEDNDDNINDVSTSSHMCCHCHTVCQAKRQQDC